MVLCMKISKSLSIRASIFPPKEAVSKTQSFIFRAVHYFPIICRLLLISYAGLSLDHRPTDFCLRMRLCCLAFIDKNTTDVSPNSDMFCPSVQNMFLVRYPELPYNTACFCTQSLLKRCH